MQKKTSLNFDKNFLWGASVSAHQVEGGNHNQWSEWELHNAKALVAQASYQYEDFANWDEIKKQTLNPDNYVSGAAANHYEMYQQDFDILSQMNMNAFRFSIEWSRIEPNEGGWNAEAIAHYKQYIQELKKRGIEPVVTLFHFTLPVWFTEMGGFSKRKNIKYFVRFAEMIISELGPHVKQVITINEPMIYAGESYLKGQWPPQATSKWECFRVVCNLIAAHNHTAKALKSINSRLKISVAQNSSFYYAGDDAWLSNVSASIMQYVTDDFFLMRVRKNCDFLGLNYYFSNRVYGYRVHNDDKIVTDLGWEFAPENIEHTITRLSDKYRLPILITENGLADSDDDLRKQWLMRTIAAIHAAKENGATITGYLHWSLLDNFEWAHGSWPRFGLVEVDYENAYKRTPRPSAIWFSKAIIHMRGK